MAYIYPFKGIRYSQTTSDKIAPPYDVVDSDYRKRLISRSKHNIISIILPDAYDKAKQLLDSWIDENVLRMDYECLYYLYTAEYEFDGIKKTLKGFLGALKLEEFGGSIKPHEKTLKGPKIDRFNLITKTNGMFCPIMGIYSPQKDISTIIDNTIKIEKPMIDVEFENIRHRVYAVNDTDTIHNTLQKENVIIADGHHRYETALMIKEYYNKQGIEHGGFDYIMTLFIDAKEGGLSLFPIHRLVKKVNNFDEFKNRLSMYFDIKENKTKCDFLMYRNKTFYSLTFKEKRSDDLIKKLDVSIFEDYVYKAVLNLTEDDIKNQTIAGYAHSQEEVINIVDKNEADVGFILNPMNYDDLVNIANKGLTVPQKSTFFHPKIPSGLIGYHFESIKDCDNV